MNSSFKLIEIPRMNFHDFSVPSRDFNQIASLSYAQLTAHLLTFDLYVRFREELSISHRVGDVQLKEKYHRSAAKLKPKL